MFGCFNTCSGVQWKLGDTIERESTLQMERIIFLGCLFTRCPSHVSSEHQRTTASFPFIYSAICWAQWIDSPTNILTFVLLGAHCSAHKSHRVKGRNTYLPSRRFSSDLSFFFLFHPQKSNPFACCSTGRNALRSKWQTMRTYILFSHRSLC